MNLRQLEHLVAVAEEGSLAAAARRVHLSQPALTRSIQTLEEQAGLALCDRSARGVVLTAAGKVAVERARRILFETSCLKRDLSLIQQHEIGEVCFGLGSWIAPIVLADTLSTLQRDWPKLRVAVEVNDGDELLAALRNEKLDFIVLERRFIPRTPDLEVRRFRAIEVGCFVRPEHPLADQEVSMTQLRRTALASVPFPKRAREHTRGTKGYRPIEQCEFQVESNDFRALAQLACRTDVVLFAPPLAVAAEAESGQLVRLRLPAAACPPAHFEIAYLAQRTLSPAAERALVAIQGASRGDSAVRFGVKPQSR
ncbi:MAG: LysR family transcriptional regulator [Burkholderiaceae bacterium]